MVRSASLSLPSTIEIVEVGPRDGLQSFPAFVPLEAKLKIIDRLAQSGLRTIEVTGFAHAAKIPQFADAEALCERLPRIAGVRYRGMAPNARGAVRAAATGVDEVVGLITASAVYLRKNQNMAMQEAVDQGIAAFRIADAANKSFVMAIGLAFWCAYEGPIDEDRVIDLLRIFRNAGIKRFYLAATVGLENPVHVARLFERVYDKMPDLELGFHVHNLGGRASALTLAAVAAGARWVEGSICGIGGGIAMPSHMQATGNYATEDVVALFEDSGIETSLFQDEVIAASRDIAAILGIEPRSFSGNGGARRDVLALAARTGGPHESG